MLVLTVRVSVSTSLPTVSNGTSAIDTLGFPFFTHCTKASLSDDAGLLEMLKKNIEYFKSKPMNIPKITILLDNGYHPNKLQQELEKIYPQIMKKIRFELSPKPCGRECDQCQSKIGQTRMRRSDETRYKKNRFYSSQG